MKGVITLKNTKADNDMIYLCYKNENEVLEGLKKLTKNYNVQIFGIEEKNGKIVMCVKVRG